MPIVGGAIPAGMYRGDDEPPEPCKDEWARYQEHSAKEQKLIDANKPLVKARRDAKDKVNRIKAEIQSLLNESDSKIEAINWWEKYIRRTEVKGGDYSEKRSRQQNTISELEAEKQKTQDPAKIQTLTAKIDALKKSNDILQKMRMEADEVATFHRGQIQSLSDEIHALEAQRLKKIDELADAESAARRAAEALEDYLKELEKLERQGQPLFDAYFNCITKS